MSATDPQSTAADPVTESAAETPAVDGFSAADTSDIAAMSYEQARSELVETVSRLETGGAGLEESLALWERGEALADRCEAWLAGARRRLDEVRAKVAGSDPSGGAGTGRE